MKASDVIAKLAELISEFGDCEVFINRNPLKENLIDIEHVYYKCDEEGIPIDDAAFLIEGK